MRNPILITFERFVVGWHLPVSARTENLSGYRHLWLPGPLEVLMPWELRCRGENRLGEYSSFPDDLKWPMNVYLKNKGIPTRPTL